MSDSNQSGSGENDPFAPPTMGPDGQPQYPQMPPAQYPVQGQPGQVPPQQAPPGQYPAYGQPGQYPQQGPPAGYPQGGYPQGGYPQGGYPQGYPPQSYVPQAPPGSAGGNKKAGWSLALSLVGILGILIPLIGLVCGGVGIYLGSAAKREIRESGGAQTGRGMAQAGFVIGIVVVVLAVLAAVSFATRLNLHS